MHLTAINVKTGLKYHLLIELDRVKSVNQFINNKLTKADEVDLKENGLPPKRTKFVFVICPPPGQMIVTHLDYGKYPQEVRFGESWFNRVFNEAKKLNLDNKRYLFAKYHEFKSFGKAVFKRRNGERVRF